MGIVPIGTRRLSDLRLQSTLGIRTHTFEQHTGVAVIERRIEL